MSSQKALEAVDLKTIICLTSASSALTLKSATDAHALPELNEESISIDQAGQLGKNTIETDIAQIKQIYIIVSILSGNQTAALFQEKILSHLLRKLNLPESRFEVIHTKDANTISDLTKNKILPAANLGESQLIILLSGDGGIVDILNALSPRSATYAAPQVSLIPMGTGNALANSSGLADATLGLATLTRGTAKPLPIFKTTFSSAARLLTDEGRLEESFCQSSDGIPTLYGAVVCSWGMHASLVADSDTAEYRKHGVDRFKMAANEALYPADGDPPHAYRAKVSILPTGSDDWRDVPRTEHAYVLTSLVSNLEKGFTISPASKPLEGDMRIVHFGPMSGDAIMGLMTRAYAGGEHVKETSVNYESVDGVKISFEGGEEDGRWRRICVDGMIVRVEKDGWVETRRERETLLNLRYLAR